MKTKFLIITLILFAFACQNTTKENTEQTHETAEIAEDVIMDNALKAEINISGMTCSGCENAIQNSINSFEGVYSSKADHKTGLAILEFDSTKVDFTAIKAAINDIGYEATDHSIIAE